MRLAESATRAPIGLVLFNRDFVERKWLMPGLKLIVEEGTLIPVVIGMSYPELEEAWRASNVAASQFDEALLKKIGRNTFVVDDWGWEHKRLRERICCAVLRIFVEEVCPRLPDAVSSMRYVMRALSAAQRIAAHELAYLKGADYDEAAHWVRHLQNIRDGHSPFDAPLPVFSG